MSIVFIPNFILVDARLDLVGSLDEQPNVLGQLRIASELEQAIFAVFGLHLLVSQSGNPDVA